MIDIADIPVESGGGIDWETVQREWSERRYVALGQVVAARLGKVAADVDALLFAPERPTNDGVRDVLESALALAGQSPDGALLLALLVYGRCLEKWERTEDYERIGIVINALVSAANKAGLPGTSGALSDRLASIVVAQAEVLETEMTVEDAVSCSCPIALGARAGKVATSLASVLEREAALDPGLDDPRQVVKADAASARGYYATLVKVADAVCAFVVQPGPGPTECFDEALRALDESVGDIDDVYESELRAHRAGLEALRECAARPRLEVGAAEVVYLYPFALEGIEPGQAVKKALDGGLATALASLGSPSSAVHELELNDLWVRDDPVEAIYSGASIELPAITVKTTGSDDPDDYLEFDAEVRLSRLGNHHLRIRSFLTDAGPHELNQALRRGSHAMGEEEHRTSGDDWKKTKFPLYAEHVLETLARSLRATVVIDPSAKSHVIVAARSVSVQHADGSSVAATLPMLEQAVGASLLFQPVRHLATSLEEWIRYPTPTVTNLLSQEAYSGDFVARTENTTVSLMSASPEWLIDEYEEMIEFVASLPPLLTLWEGRASLHAEKLDSLLRRPDASIGALHRYELAILELEQEIRLQLALIRSPRLCRTRGQRRFLDALLDAAGLRGAERELERQLTQLAERQKRIAALVRQREQERSDEQHERSERFSRRIEIVLGVLAAVSLVGVLQWVNDSFGFTGDSLAGGELIGLLAAWVAIYVFIVRPSRRHLAFRDLDADEDAELLHRFYGEILVPSFSADELDDLETIERGLRGDGDVDVLASVALARDGAPIGGMVGEIHAQEKVLLLSYIAVHHSRRAHGVGTALMRRVAPRWYSNPAVQLALAEVRDPRSGPESPEDDPDARLRFYERLGARVLAVPFVQPSLAGGRQRVPGFFLLALHVDPSIDGGNSIPSDVVARFVRRYYEIAEGIVSPDDAQFNRLLGLIEEHPTIALLPIAGYAGIPTLD